ncbi:hypothetical protein CROQUDRAFT_89357 [Cronartium quercuum f. sp. fusiforme G11]|uniref:Uncharacterized protein n=1 Tax=Cronartium quercuum f. sp. fusiforme G11 TaxID=708437 RepID=A0A9P6TEE1_9BASI|nr:hypothetical protein CROQUDRAFT_89357 [Cronartium quercuum f. sp. fusiforme G11]
MVLTKPCKTIRLFPCQIPQDSGLVHEDHIDLLYRLHPFVGLQETGMMTVQRKLSVAPKSAFQRLTIGRFVSAILRGATSSEFSSSRERSDRFAPWHGPHFSQLRSAWTWFYIHRWNALIQMHFDGTDRAFKPRLIAASQGGNLTYENLLEVQGLV